MKDSGSAGMLDDNITSQSSKQFTDRKSSVCVDEFQCS